MIQSIIRTSALILFSFIPVSPKCEFTLDVSQLLVAAGSIVISLPRARVLCRPQPARDEKETK